MVTVETQSRLVAFHSTLAAIKMKIAFLSACFFSTVSSFAPTHGSYRQSSSLFMAEEAEAKAAPLVSGEDLEMMLADFEQPLVIDAYATW